MSYNEVFGGGTINPAQRTYLSLVTAVDVTLQWPTNTVGGDDVAADIIDVDATQPGVDISLSDARQVSNGFTSLFVNVGSQNFQVLDALGATIVSPAVGTAWFIYLTDNTTEDGTWATFQLGATVSVADAAALAGAGIKAISATLNQSIPPTLTAITPINWADANRALFTVWTGGVGVLNLPTVASVGSDWFGLVRNEGSGTLTLTPAAGTIDGAATLIMNPGDSVFVVTDGSNWFTIGLGGSTTVGFDYVSIDVSGSGDFILSGVQLNRISYKFVGTLTGNRKIVVPSTIQQYWMDNSTTGAFTLEIATAAQITPVGVAQTNRAILYCDGTDVIDAETGTVVVPVTIGQGGTSATTADGAMDNLGVGRDVLTPALSGLAGGGDLSADLTLLLDINNLTLEMSPDPATDFVAIYDDSLSMMRKVLIQNITGDSLVDSGGNVRAFAATNGVLQLRSDASVDAQPRALHFTHQDGTLALLIGQTLFSEEMFIQNLINDADADIFIQTNNANANIELQPNGVFALRITASGPVAKGTVDNTAQLRFGQAGASNTIRATIGYRGSNNFDIDNGIISGEIHFFATDSGSSERLMCEMNPNGDIKFWHNPGGGAIQVARTLDDGDGGFEINNLLTGGGFERALTEGGDYGVSRVNVQNGNYTTVASDQGKTISKRSGGAGEIVTIDSNANVPYPIGTMIAFNNDGGGTWAIQITTDTLVNAATNGVGSRNLADGGYAVAEKVNTTVWKISGQQLT